MLEKDFREMEMVLIKKRTEMRNRFVERALKAGIIDSCDNGEFEGSQMYFFYSVCVEPIEQAIETLRSSYALSLKEISAPSGGLF